MRKSKEIALTPYQIAMNNALLDEIIVRFGLKNDAGLARYLKVQAPIISRIRWGKALISALILTRVHEIGGMPFSEIRKFVPDWLATLND